MTRQLFSPLSVVLFVIFSAVAFAQDDPSLTRLYDTKSPSAQPYAGPSLDKPAAWALVPEETTTHTFAGDAIFMNDKIAVVLRKQGPGVEVHYKTSTGFKIGAGLANMGAKGMDPLAGLKIVENGSGAVTMETTYKSGAKLNLRMTTGEGTLEVQPGDKAVALGIDSPTNYLLVPDFFGDDLVFAEKAYTGRALPAENMCLNLLAGGDAMMMCVWQSSKQHAWLLAAEGNMRTMRIDCMPEKKIWLAFMEGAGMWRADNAPIVFKPPFPAKWRTVSESFDPVLAFATKDSARSTPLIKYPLDREADTPLTAVLPTDVMRNTLGVGPCQYILAVEGMAAEGDPTPNNVMNWVEKQFEEKKEVKAADDIKERLDLMVKHITEANGRLKVYDDFAKTARITLRGNPKFATYFTIIEFLDRSASGITPPAPPETAGKLAAQVIALEGKPNGAAECKKLGEQLRKIGEYQDHSMARCRMAIRRLYQEGRTLNGPAPAGAIAEIQAAAAKLLESNAVE